MHKIDIPDSVTQRVIARRGKAHPFDDLNPATTALIVIDMQNGFMVPELAHALCPMAETIVPHINRLADALRNAGGKVFWIQNTHSDNCLSDWSVMYDYLRPQNQSKRIQAMSPGTKGHQFWPGLDIKAQDEIVAKTRYSAFIQGSSDLPQRLKQQGYDTVLITGTVTNTCCESSARDAMMLNFKTIMVADGCAAQNDSEHNASLVSFYLIFGDVMTVAELEQCFEKNRQDVSR